MDDLNFNGAYEYLPSTNDNLSGLNQIQFQQNDVLEPISFTHQLPVKSKMTIVKIDNANINDDLLNPKNFLTADPPQYCDQINQAEYLFNQEVDDFSLFDESKNIADQYESLNKENEKESSSLTLTNLLNIDETEFNNNTLQDDSNNTENNNNNNSRDYFTTKIPSESSFQLSLEDWNKLRSLQKGHRFLRGEWEDYFVVGMKDSNKYCVFAFKDHYVNQSSVRKRKTNMSHVAKGSVCANSPTLAELKGKKMFSANGYCVFEDCPIKFLVKMNAERVVHVFYEGEIRHSANEVHARYFRGKSRQELKEALKHTTPMKEYLQRVRSSACNGNLEAGNADFVGKSTAVYRRIASEAKDCYQALLQLRNQLIQKSLVKIQQRNSKKNIPALKSPDNNVLGYIQMIQHIPGCIICYEYDQLRLFHSLFINRLYSCNQSVSNSCLYISFFKDTSLVSTTINSKSIFYYEMSIRNPISLDSQSPQLLPLTCMLTTNPRSSSIIEQWLKMFLNTEKNIFYDFYMNEGAGPSNIKYIMCDNSMGLIETILNCFNQESFETYSNRCFFNIFESYMNNEKSMESNNEFQIDFDDINEEILQEDTFKSFPNTLKKNQKVIVHTCTDKLMNEINQLCKLHYSSGNNFNFGMYAFSVIVNSHNLLELQNSIYSFMCILYSNSINPLVERAFEYLKSKVNYYQSLSRSNKKNSTTKNEFYLYNSNFRSSGQKNPSSQNSKAKSFQIDEESDDFSEKNVGLSLLKRSKKNIQIEEFKLKCLNKTSMFHKMCEKLFEKCKYEIKKCEAEKLNSKMARNPRQGQQLLYYFVNQFSASLPLWTKINMPIIDSEYDSSHSFPLTLSAKEERFRLLHSMLTINEDEKEKETLDIFIKQLSEENKNLIEPNVEFFCKDKYTQQFEEKSGSLSQRSSLIQLVLSDENCDSDEDEKPEEIGAKRNSNKNDLIRISSFQSLTNSDDESLSKKTGRINTKKRKILTNESITPNVHVTIKSLAKIPRATEEEREIIIEREHHSIANDFGFELKKEDLETLDNSPNLNIIEFYLKMLELKPNLNPSDFRVLVYSVQFYKNLKYECDLKKNISTVKEPIAPSLDAAKNIFDYNLVLIPIQKGDKWSLAAIDFRKQKITYYDPLLLNDFDCLRNLTEFIDKQFYFQKTTKYDFRNWKISNEKNIIKNIDLKDCGIFMLLYAKRLVTNQEMLSKTKDDLENFRSQLKNEIFQHLFAT